MRKTRKPTKPALKQETRLSSRVASNYRVVSLHRRTAQGSSEAPGFKLGRHGRVVEHGAVSLFGFGGWDVADRLEQTPVVELVDPFEGAYSTPSKDRHGPRRWITSAL